jgi:hypothetical protein
MSRHLSPGAALVVIATLLPAALAAADPAPATDVDAPPTLSIGAARVLEGDSGTSHLLFPVHLSGPPNRIATVSYATEDGTATVADRDYETTRGKLIFGATDTLLTIDVPVTGDLRIEGNEWLRMRLSDPVGFSFADSEAFGVIANDERATFEHMWVGSTDYLDGSLPTAWSDFNRDGDLDITLFFGGTGTTFSEIPGFRALLADGNYHGVSTCDYDRDGDNDLVALGYCTTCFDGEDQGGSPRPPTPNVLLQNQGDGTFVNVASTAGMDIAGNAETAVWGDFDGDGWPDRFAPYYGFLYPFQCFLWHNNQDGTFTDRAAAAGVAMSNVPGTLRPEGACAADWNDDGYLDIYCASHLFLNDGTGHFTDVREAVGLPEIFDEGAQFVDFDNDGDFDLYLRGGYYPNNHPFLFRNDAGNYFTDASTEAGIAGIPLFWGDSWADVDDDGDLDLLQVGANSTTRLMLNQGDGTFVADPDFASQVTGRELTSWGDADGDGDLDMVVGPNGKRILINQLNNQPFYRGSHMRVDVLDEDGYQTMHGATVRLTRLGGGPRDIQTRFVDGGSGYLSQNEYTVSFGGLSSGTFALEVVYPSARGRVVIDSLVDPRLGSITGANGPRHGPGLQGRPRGVPAPRGGGGPGRDARDPRPPRRPDTHPGAQRRVDPGHDRRIGPRGAGRARRARPEDPDHRPRHHRSGAARHRLEPEGRSRCLGGERHLLLPPAGESGSGRLAPGPGHALIPPPGSSMLRSRSRSGRERWSASPL